VKRTSILPGKLPAAAWRRIPQGKNIQTLLRRQSPGAVPAISTRLTNTRQTAVHVGTGDPGTEEFEILGFARKMVVAATSEKAGSLGIWVTGFDDEENERIMQALVAAALAAALVMPSYKSKDGTPKIKSIRLFGLANRVDLGRIAAEAEGNNVARWLTAQPANKLDATSYTKLLKDLATDNNWLELFDASGGHSIVNEPIGDETDVGLAATLIRHQAILEIGMYGDRHVGRNVRYPDGFAEWGFGLNSLRYLRYEFLKAVYPSSDRSR